SERYSMPAGKRGKPSQQIDAKSIIATVREPMLVLDADLHVIFANRSFYDSFHVDKKETEGQRIYDLGNGQWDIPALKQLLEGLLPQNTVFNDFEVEHEFPEIGRRTMLLNARRIYKEHEKTQFILLAIEDITEHLKTRAELRARDTQLSLIKTHTCDIIFAIGVEPDDVFRFHWVNQRFLEATGLAEKQIVGKPIQEVIPKPAHELVLGKYREAIRTGKAVRWEETSVYPAGKKTGEVSIAPVFDTSGNCTQLIGTVHDISEQKQAHKALAASEEKFSRLANESLVGIYIIQDGVFKYINPRLAEIFGYTEEELIDRLGPEQLVFEEDRPLVAENIRKRIEGVEKSAHYTFRGITRERKVIDIEAFGSFTHYQGQAAVIGSLLDITEQKKNEQSLIHMQKQTRQIIDTARDAFVSMDSTGSITDWNPQAEKTFGWQRKEAIGQSISKIIIPPESREAHEKGLKHFLESNEGPVLNQHIETNALHRDGHTFPVELSIVPAYSDGDVSFHAFVRNLSAQAEARKMLKNSLVGTIVAVARAVGARDPYTAGHQQRVAQLARSIAQEMGLDTDRVDGLRMGATIHDIGKIYLPSEILSKPTRLSETEFELVKTHCQVGYDILKDIIFPWPIADIAHQHHERLDGTGYPQGLKGDEICLEARIVAVADVVEAISSHRPYREGLGIDVALQEIKTHRGEWYEPDAVDACLNLFRKGAFSFE
ncbi:MAG: PAS domain S-box protein, partial [Mariprofundus sp.]|nr:PAS domain S-box protein [Mariprofundus sp.]